MRGFSSRHVDSLRYLKRLGKGCCWHLCVSLALPLLLLFAQLGSLHHGLHHHAAPDAAHGSGEPHPVGEACSLCLAFAPVDSAAAPDGEIPRRLVDLAVQAAPSVAAACWVADLPQHRSRGPPAYG